MDALVRYLKPIKRKTYRWGRTNPPYVHYVVCTTVPEAWKRGVKVVVTPLPERICGMLKEVRRTEGYLEWLKEHYPDHYRRFMEHFEEEAEMAQRDERLYEEWVRTRKGKD